MIKTKRAGLVTKLVVLILLTYVAVTLWNLNTRISQARDEVSSLTQQRDTQTQQNTVLSEAIEHSDDPEHRKDIARQRLGLLEPGEKVFHITD